MSSSDGTLFQSPIYIGVDYPLRNDGILNYVPDYMAINAGLYQLIMTEPGERVNEIEFGIRLRDIIFEMNDDSTLEEIKLRIADGIETWEKRIYLPEEILVNRNLMELKNGQLVNTGMEIQNGVYVFFKWSFKMDLERMFIFENPVFRNAS